MPATVLEKHLLINNEWRPSSSGKTMEVVNPATEEVIASVASAGAPDVDAAVAAARAALDGPWGSMSARERGRLVSRLPMPPGRHMPGQLQRPGALAHPLRPTKQEQLTHPKPTMQVRVERTEPGRDAPQPVRPPRPHIPVELFEHPTQADDPMPMHPRLPRLPRHRHPIDPLQAAEPRPPAA